MRQSKTFLTDTIVFKEKLLHWASVTSDRVCFLNGNGYKNIPHGAFDCMLGVGCIEEISGDNDNSFSLLREFVGKNEDWLFGFLSYDLKNEIEDLSSSNSDQVGFPVLHFFRPAYVFTIRESQVTIAFLPEQKSEREVDNIFDEILHMPPGVSVDHAAPPEILNRIAREEYIRRVEAIREHIRIGDIFEMNFCQEFYVENILVDPVLLYLSLNRLSPAPFSCYYRLGKRYLLSSSPERFIKKEGSQIISQPIKGTIRRGKNAEEDMQLKQELFHDPKERSENVMIVDLVRNDLSRSCKAGTVRVEELYGIYSFSQVHQMISTVTGEMKEEIQAVDVIRNAFPMGSMTGAPKVRAMQLIEEYESTCRGLFSGAVGYFDPEGNFDLNVVIRSMLYDQDKKYLSFMTGSAITFGSVAEKEYEECLLKAKAMLRVLEQGILTNQ